MWLERLVGCRRQRVIKVFQLKRRIGCIYTTTTNQREQNCHAAFTQNLEGFFRDGLCICFE